MLAGELNVDAMLRRITAKQLREWQLYHELEPFGEWRADVRAAQITAMIFNMAVAPKNRKPLDYFLLPWDKALEEPRKQTWQEQQKILTMMAMAFNTSQTSQ